MAAVMACGGEDAAGVADDAPPAFNAADPEALRPRETANPELSEAERALLLRAKGRRWRAATPEALDDFLADDTRATRVLYVWDEAAGGEGLRAFQSAISTWDANATAAAVVLAAETVGEEALVSLRSSQLPYPAYVTSVDARVGGERLRNGEALVAGAPATGGEPLRVPVERLADLYSD